MATPPAGKVALHPSSTDGNTDNDRLKPANSPVTSTTCEVPTIAITTQTPADTTSSSIGDSLLREYAVHLDPLNTNGETHANYGPEESSSTISQASTQVDNSPQDYATSLPTSPLFPLRAPKSFLNHRKGVLSIETIPRQTILKALVSRPPNAGIPTMPLTASLSGLLSAPKEQDGKP
ncbi:MAG: NAD(+) kinase, partial [Pleopsidium flavum]